MKSSSPTKRKRYLFFDIDGTLLAGTYSEPYIPESTVLALKLLREAGHFLCIATGRSQAMAVRYMEELGFDNMVSDGGYGITIDRKLLGIRPLDRDAVAELIRECETRGMPWSIQTENSGTRLAPDSRFDEITGDTYLKTRIIKDLDPCDHPVIYKAYIACRHPQEMTLKALKSLPWCRYDNEYIFVEPTDKAQGIRKILDSFGADHSDAIVFGDAYNDMSMFSDVWTNVAMGNAVPELKARADLVTDDVDKDGIFNACVRLGLLQQDLP